MSAYVYVCICMSHIPNYIDNMSMWLGMCGQQTIGGEKTGSCDCHVRLSLVIAGGKGMEGIGGKNEHKNNKTQTLTACDYQVMII